MVAGCLDASLSLPSKGCLGCNAQGRFSKLSAVMDLDILLARVQRIIREKPKTDRLWVDYQELFEREFANELSRKPLNSLYEVLQSKILEGENTCRLSVTSLELIDTLAGLHHPDGWPEAGEAATESPWLQVAYR